MTGKLLEQWIMRSLHNNSHLLLLPCLVLGRLRGIWRCGISKVNIILTHKHENTVSNMGSKVLYAHVTKMKLKSSYKCLLLQVLAKPAACPSMRWDWVCLFLPVDREKLSFRYKFVCSPLSLTEWFSGMTQEGLEISFPLYQEANW